MRVVGIEDDEVKVLEEADVPVVDDGGVTDIVMVLEEDFDVLLDVEDLKAWDDVLVLEVVDAEVVELRLFEDVETEEDEEEVDTELLDEEEAS